MKLIYSDKSLYIFINCVAFSILNEWNVLQLMCKDTFKPLIPILFLNDMVENEKCCKQFFDNSRIDWSKKVLILPLSEEIEQFYAVITL